MEKIQGHTSQWSKTTTRLLKTLTSLSFGSKLKKPRSKTWINGQRWFLENVVKASQQLWIKLLTFSLKSTIRVKIILVNSRASSHSRLLHHACSLDLSVAWILLTLLDSMTQMPEGRTKTSLLKLSKIWVLSFMILSKVWVLWFCAWCQMNLRE